ncbi:MAG: beta-glucosidase [Hyphomonadaceae bacterium]|nr:MAG: beta-glucosidase [Hyphomonadaceae bacterium]
MKIFRNKLLIGSASIATVVAAIAVPMVLNAQTARTQQYSDWPHIHSPFASNATQEREIAAIVQSMTLAQKIGQMTQPEIKKITPAEVRQYYIGSVLNGGGSWPQMNKHASVQDWVNLSDAYYAASMSTDMEKDIPIIWGIDAVHGNSNVVGATLYPHNIGLGAARNPALIEEIGRATARAVRATGINWAFAPTLAVVQNQRWGRSYESFAVNPDVVRQYGAAYVRGMQGDLTSDANIVATAKHFLGDGGTFNGVNEGQNRSSLADLINIHGAGYFGALGAGAQTVMITYNSWAGAVSPTNNGKIHGVPELVTGALKEKMGFDGFVVSDWNGIAQVQGCTNSHCPESINAGVDMVMVPDDWKDFITNTMKDVEEGRIPMSRIDDAVTRIIRVKMRAGLFTHKPSDSSVAGKVSEITNRALARRAVRQSMVLLKNNNGVLPLARGKRILVVGASADSMSNQSGGWSITWQGDENTNADFTTGETLLSAIRSQAGAARVVYSPTGMGVNLRNFDVVIAVLGETPYAETKGDAAFPTALNHSLRHPNDQAVLDRISGRGVPVVSVLYSGRTLYANSLINKSNAFVAAFLPGSEAAGITDVLFRNARGQVAHNFSGKLSFPWPSNACPPATNAPQTNYRPLFNYGYGLDYLSRNNIGVLPIDRRTTCPSAQ